MISTVSLSVVCGSILCYNLPSSPHPIPSTDLTLLGLGILRLPQAATPKSASVTFASSVSEFTSLEVPIASR